MLCVKTILIQSSEKVNFKYLFNKLLKEKIRKEKKTGVGNKI